LVHRVIKAILAKKSYHLPALPTPGEAHARLSKRLEKSEAAKAKHSGDAPKKMSAELLAWQAAGLHCSANERRADEASRDVEAWLKCKYMREHLGEEFAGVVTAATSFGIFVTLDAMYVEGLVHITELGGEYYRFDEARQELRGERTGIRYAIGTRVQVQVSRVDLDGRRIDFRLVRGDEVLGIRGLKDKAVGKSGSFDVETAPHKTSAKRGAKTQKAQTMALPTPIQALKQAVKKAAAQNKNGKTSKGRKSRRAN
jgi:ribonuclease R